MIIILHFEGKRERKNARKWLGAAPKAEKRAQQDELNPVVLHQFFLSNGAPQASDCPDAF